MAKPLALTSGEPAGIGPDIAIEAWLRRSAANLPPFYLLGDRGFFAERARHLGLKADFAEVGADEAAAAFAKALPVVATGKAATAAPGRPDAASADAVLASIRQAVADVTAGRASAVVTNPIAKSVLYRAGFKHPGHTEFLADLAHSLWGVPRPHPVMMLASDLLRVVPVTVHIPLAKVPAALTADLLGATLAITHDALRRDFGIAQPRIAVAGLNPHAGEGGLIGREDMDLIAPVLEVARGRGLSVLGPLSADTLFHAQARASYDAALAMYHDQALIPIKTLSFDTGVNVTLGLPFVRTSPDHGTAFALAGTGQARPDSFIAALRLADEIASRRGAAAVGRAP